MAKTEQSPLHVYKTGPARSAWALLVLSGICILAVIMLGYFAYLGEIYQHGMARSFNSIIPYLCIGSIFVCTALLAIGKLITQKRTEITLLEDVIKVKSKARNYGIPYKDIQYIFRRHDLFLYFIFPVWKKEIAIQTQTGIAKIDGSIDHFEQLVNEVEAKVYPTFYLDCQEILAAGKSISFGVIQLDQQGIKFNEEIILWNQVAKMTVAKGNVILKYWIAAKLSELKTPANTIPNLPVLLKLADDYIHSAGSF